MFSSIGNTEIIMRTLILSHYNSKQKASYATYFGRCHSLSLSAFTLFCRESKRLLLAEGSIMASLNHERVVKLLGVIMEDKDCSLVMELIPRGNLLAMLVAVSSFNICG